MNIAFTYDQLLKCGGTRIAFEYCRELSRQGHVGTIYANWVSPEMDDWIERYGVKPKLLKDYERQDVVISCWWRQMDEIKRLPAGKYFHLVQGRDRLSYADGHTWREESDAAMRRTDFDFLAVSSWAGDSCRTPKIVPNGVDRSFWRPAAFNKLVPPAVFTILLEASTMDPYKGLTEALEACERIKVANPAKVIKIWLITRDNPNKPIVERVIEKPNDVQILGAYQNADCLVKATWFDGFGLPHLEAMACGLPLVTTNAGGNMDFCRHDTNCLISEPHDVDSLVRNIQSLIDSKILRQRLAQGGLLTAQKWSWQRSVEKLIEAVTD